MPSSYTASLRLELQAQGENPNQWGQPKLNNVISRLDFAVAGMVTKALTGDYELTSSNSSDDEARAAILKFTGGAGPFTVKIPSVPKEYKVWNACAGNVVITTGAGATVAIQPTEIAEIICDGANVKATGYDGRTEKQYLDQRVVEFGAVPSGLIAMWSGSALSIPSGWVLCNGTNGAPDLRDRFVVGAGASYAVGTTGGAATVTLDQSMIPAHQHGGTTSGQTADHVHGGYSDHIGDHQHSIDLYHGAGGGPVNTPYAFTGAHAGAPLTSLAGGHSHSIATYGASNDHAHNFITAAVGGGAAHENRPPYYALCFIMKV